MRRSVWIIPLYAVLVLAATGEEAPSAKVRGHMLGENRGRVFPTIRVRSPNDSIAERKPNAKEPLETSRNAGFYPAHQSNGSQFR